MSEDVNPKVDGAELIATERRRQIEGEGWSANHDDSHRNSQLAIAAAFYAVPPHLRGLDDYYADSFLVMGHVEWPWHPTWWKPTPEDRIRELAKAGALIAAEIDRIERSMP